MECEIQWSKDQKSLTELSSEAAFSNFLRHYRGQSSLASVIATMTTPNSNNHFEINLERIRNLVYQNKTDGLSEILDSTIARNPLEVCELNVERLRYFLLKSDFEKALALSNELINDESLPTNSLLTCFQLRGDLFLKLGNPQKAKDELLSAFDLMQFFPLQRSSFSTLGFLAIAELKLNNIESARYYLEYLRKCIENLSQNELKADRILIYLRTQIQFFRKLNKFDDLQRCLVKCKTLAFWLNELAIYNRCIDELKELNQIGSEVQSEQFKNWLWIEEVNILLTFEPRKVLSFEHSPLTRTFLQILTDGPIAIEVLFEKLWGLKYNEKIHNQHLRSTLSNLRKNLLGLQVKTRDGNVHIE